VPHTSPRYRSRLRPLGDADFGRIVKKAARNAGTKEEGGPPPRAEEVVRGGGEEEEEAERHDDGRRTRSSSWGTYFRGRRTLLRIGRQRPGLDDKLQQPLDRR